jgi:hypothetical protein
MPILWLHAARADEQKTAVKEKRLAEGRVQDGQPAN